MLPQNTRPGGAEDRLHRTTAQWVSVKHLLLTFSFKCCGNWPSLTWLTVSRQKQSLLDEGSLMSRLNHQRVVKLLGVILEDGDYSLVMELIPKGNLLTMLETVIKGSVPKYTSWFPFLFMKHSDHCVIERPKTHRMYQNSCAKTPLTLVWQFKKVTRMSLDNKTIIKMYINMFFLVSVI